jgi:hypothetical protein
MKPSNHTPNLHRPTNFPWLSSSEISELRTELLSLTNKLLLWTVSQSHIATDGKSISLGVKTHLGLMTGDWLLGVSCGRVVGGRSRWREDGGLLDMLLALASVVFLGSEPLGTRDHILLPQIWDFLFRLLHRYISEDRSILSRLFF